MIAPTVQKFQFRFLLRGRSIFVLSPPTTTTRVIPRPAASHISPALARTAASGPAAAAAPFGPTSPTLLVLLILLVLLVLPLPLPLLLAIAIMITTMAMMHRMFARRHRRRRHPSLLRLLLLRGLLLLRWLIATQRRIPSRRRVVNIARSIIPVRIVQRSLGARAGPLVVLVPVLDE
jgi:hypothetical protein